MKGWGWALLIGIAALAYYLYSQSQGSINLDDVLSGGASDAGSSSDVGITIANALSNFENVASVHNNPTGICGSFIGGVCQGPKTFDSFSEGLQAGAAKIDSWLAANPSITVAQFVAKWSGGTGQVLQNYVSSVAGDLGLDADEPIADAGGSGD